MRKKIFILMSALVLLFIVVIGYGSAATGDPVLLNEVYASHTGTDNTEFIELYGTPGTSLTGLSVIVVEGDAFGPGSIDRRFDFRPFHALGANGFFLVGNCAGLPDNYGVTPDASLFTNYLENNSLTVALVETNSISGGDVTGSEVVLDAVALTDGDTGDTFYFGAPVIGPDGTFYPAGARRQADGVDTDTTADWTISDFNLGSANTPTPGGFNGCAPLELTIPEIQGDGQRSIYEGEVVTTSGVVTLYSANGRDFWLQDPDGDGNPATSDAIVVDDGGFLPGPPQVGDFIEITAVVEEQQFGTSLPLTRLDAPSAVSILSSGNPLPAPVPLTDLPDTWIPDGEAFWEPLEGMRVMVENAPVTAPTNGFGEFGILTEADAVPRSGYFPQTKQIIIQSHGDDIVDYNPERIMVDDTSLNEPIIVNPGDLVHSLVGVVDYTFSMYKLQPDPGGYDVETHNLPKMPVSKRSGPKGDLTITTYNVENLFDLVDNPDKDDGSSTPTADELELQLSKLALSIGVELALPEIIVVQEVENTEILQVLGDRVNDSYGTDYMAVSFETSDVRGIEVGFLWDAGRVELIDAYQMSGSDVEMWFGPTSPSPGREPLVGVFEFDGIEMTIIGNHFKSKSGDDPLYGVNWPPIRVTEIQRHGQARVVRDFINNILDNDPDALVLVAGDLNDFQFAEPGELPNHTVGILEGTGDEVPLYDLVNVEKPAELYSYVFDGNGQVLDHILVSPAFLNYFAGVDILHFNAGYVGWVSADTAAGNPDSTLHSSDHDPVEARFKNVPWNKNN